MGKKIFLFCSLWIFTLSFNIYGQNNEFSIDSTSIGIDNKYQKSLFKISFPSLIIGTYNAKFERFINNKLSIQAGVAYTNFSYETDEGFPPESGGTDTYKGYTITLEFRDYFYKQHKGKYIAAFLRHYNFKLNYSGTGGHPPVQDDDPYYAVPASGKINSLGGGIIYGLQHIGKILSSDLFVGIAYYVPNTANNGIFFTNYPLLGFTFCAGFDIGI